MDELTLISCSYNTPDITLTMLRSWAAVHNEPQKVIICDNSTNEETADILSKNNIPYIRQIGDTHGNGVNKLLEKCETKYALLVDTDVIFLKNHKDIFEQFKNQSLTLLGKVEGDRGGKQIYNRVNPWHCFINVEDIRNNNIIFFDEKRMKDSFSRSKIYDIGSTFFEDIKEKKLKIGTVDLSNRYYYHFEGMSWYKNKYNGSEKDTGIDFGGTHNNYGYVNAYNTKYASFQDIAAKYKDITIKNKFI